MKTTTNANQFVEYPLPGQLYLHFKGGIYEVLSMAVHTETSEPMVIYVSRLFGTVFARPLPEWQEPAPDGGLRFTPVDDLV
jgi:hypothetical protein